MCWLYSFSFANNFFPQDFPLQGFNEAILKTLKETQEPGIKKKKKNLREVKILPIIKKN